MNNAAMAITRLPKYTGLLCLVVMVTLLIDGAQGNDKPVISNFVVLNGGVVPENAPKKTAVATYESSDDGGNYWCDALGSTFGAGIGKVITNVELNYEDKQSYTVTLKCTDDGTPPLSTSVDFNLTVSDVNEKPTFVFPVSGDTEATISMKSPSEEQYVNVTAVDEDAGDNGKFEYSFHDDYDADLFMIKTTEDGKGKITIKEAPEKESYTVTIKATDKGTPPLSAGSVPLTIKFVDRSGQASYNNIFANLLLVSIINLLYFML